MAEIESKPPAGAPIPDVKPDEVSLEEIDRLLEADDPEFAQSLNQIKEVGVEGDINIESVVAGEETLSTDDDEGEVEKKSKWDNHPILQKLLTPFKIIKAHSYTRWLRFKTRLVILARQVLILCRTLPAEFVGYIKSMLKISDAGMRASIRTIRALSWPQLFTWLGFIGLCAMTVILLKLNWGGVWLPGMGANTISDLTEQADRVWTLTPEDQMVSLFRAFPQEEIEFLFPKVIVNLKSTSVHRNPMGAFEFYVVLDSQDAALEIKARRDELHDRIQRSLEGQTYNELTSPFGKKRVKDLLRRELNDVLSQGWVKDVLIKTMVLKP